MRRPPAVVQLPAPDPIQTRDVNWRVLTPSTVPEGDFVYFGLTPRDYEALSHNQAETLRWVTEARHRLDQYRGELGK